MRDTSQAPALVAPMTVPYDKPLTCPVLIGRSREQAALAAQIECAREGRLSAVLIRGEAGIGKSRLVATARALARDYGFQLFEGHCFAADASFSYAPLLDLLSKLLTHHTSGSVYASEKQLLYELAHLLPDLAPLVPNVSFPPTPVTLEHGHHRRRLVTALTQLIARLAAHQPALLVVEDLHWCDEHTLDVLLHLARQSQRLCLLFTCRSDEVSPPLRSWLAHLERERLVLELPLTRLSRDEVAAMIQAIMGAPGPPPVALVHAVEARSEGVPFFVEELISSLVAAGELTFIDGAWQATPRLPGPGEDRKSVV